MSGRYQVGPVLGRGGMGVVHRGRDRQLDRDVALKFLPGDDPAAVARLFREARAQARVHHPGVCPVHDTGWLDGHAFIAMELVAGPSLAERGPGLSLRERARVVRDVARAVHGAHRVGVVHRDLKPSNILCPDDADGRPRPVVIDFGLARALDSATLSTHGQILGTPAYMAPEQALGQPGAIDRRADVWALGATLYELCAGAPPFVGRDPRAILTLVTDRPPPPLPRSVPADLAAIVARCLRKAPGERYDSARALADELDRFLAGEPVVARPGLLPWRARRALRRWRGPLAVAAVIAVGAVVAALAVWRASERARAARIDALDRTGREALDAAHAARARHDRALALALAAFDAGDRAAGEQRWAAVRAERVALERAYDEAARAFEATLLARPAPPGTRARLAATLAEQVTWAEARGRATARELLRQRLAVHDLDGRAALELDRPATVALALAPAGTRVALSAYVPDGQGHRIATAPEDRGAARALTLPPGSWLLELTAPGRAPVRVALHARRAEQLTIDVTLPPADAVPAGFVPVPAGRFLVGTDDEGRRALYEAPPLHEASTGPYLIARHETTVGEWLAFLDALPAAERGPRLPAVDRPDGDAVAVLAAPGGWRYRYRPTAGRTYEAGPGQPLHYQLRSRRAVQDWTRFPVTGVSADDAAAYLAWLDRSGRVPGARLCTGREWERAGRGADDREYPAGDRLDPDDANVDVTYERDDWGPDEVGAHPGSRSPFGVDDLAGNALELVAPGPRAPPGTAATRGGGFNFNAGISDLLNPNTVGATTRETSIGLRVCAPWPAPR